jgi:hypothetical protein
MFIVASGGPLVEDGACEVVDVDGLPQAALNARTPGIRNAPTLRRFIGTPEWAGSNSRADRHLSSTPSPRTFF